MLGPIAGHFGVSFTDGDAQGTTRTRENGDDEFVAKVPNMRQVAELKMPSMLSKVSWRACALLT